eukprot:TRINITY_DN8834_c0_g1_i6.p1 TRINITY_DN8834_c0_g1~~TRINITY_DN8834_c0_g1_i6.p1  ORF type:complete len:258 (-),score=49.02 TRINITY_DN8834_c0_g1_i6:243-1016(-)
MKFLLLLISFAATLCKAQEAHFFRYKDGTFKKGDADAVSITGTMYNTRMDDIREISFFGMDYSTMTPFNIYGVTQRSSPHGTVDCRMGTWNLGSQQELSGYIELNKLSNHTELNAVCVTQTGEQWTFVTRNVETPNWLYTPKEAGARAKYLIGQSSKRYRSHHVILFAIADLPDSNHCGIFLHEKYPTIDRPEIGAIMVGKDGKHCGILDDEGTKFVHSNPVLGRVTHEHLVMAQRYFPRGVIYKRYLRIPNPKQPF